MARVCKKFYILSWNQELVNKLCFFSFGQKRYNAIRFKCAKRIDQVNNGKQNDKENKPRWLIEDSQSPEESSDFWSSNDEEAMHMRHDANSSAEEENRLKDYLRRNAREERAQEKTSKINATERKEDMRQIEELKFNGAAIPRELAVKYQDEMSDLQDYEYKKKKEEEQK